MLVSGGAAAAAGLASIGSLVKQWPVSGESDLRSTFFASLWLTICGAALPLVWLLHRRFGPTRAANGGPGFGTLARQAAWVGAWGTACAWLQMHRMFSWAMGLLVAVVLVLLEALLQTRLDPDEEP